MANINIKRYNGDAWEIHYPKTTIGQVINLSSQLANMQSDIDGKVDRNSSVNGLDMNNVTESGFYHGYTMSNSAWNGISTFIVIKYSGDWIMQIQLVPSSDGSKNIYTRSRHSGTTWSSWVKLIDNNDTRLTNARTPTTHSHPKSEITNFDNEVLALSPAGARTPTAHTHTKAQITDFAHTHNYLSSIDDRDIKPNNLSYNRVQTYFTSLEGLTGTTGSDYQDLFVLNTYNDSSGGKVNALALDKSEMKIRLYQAAQADATWGTPKTLAFSEDTVNLTGNQPIAGTKTFTGDVILDTTLGATIQDSKSLIFKYNRGTIGGGITQKEMYVDSAGALRFNGAELSEVGHSHSKSDITNFDSEVLALSPAGARTPTTHSHPKSEITNFDNEVLALSPPWKIIRDIQIVIPTTLTSNNVTVVSGNYYNKILAFEVRVVTATDSYETHIVFARMGSNNGTAVSDTYDRFYSWTTFDGQYFKTHSFKAYCTNATSTVITVGALRHLIGSFSGNTIEWTTPTVTTYLERIWLVN